MSREKTHILRNELGSKIFRVIFKEKSISGAGISKALYEPKKIGDREIYHVRPRTYQILKEFRHRKLINTKTVVKGKEDTNSVNFIGLATEINRELLKSRLDEEETKKLAGILASKELANSLSRKTKLSFLDEISILLKLAAVILAPEIQVTGNLRNLREIKEAKHTLKKFARLQKGFKFLESFDFLERKTLEKLRTIEDPYPLLTNFYYFFF